MQFDDTTIEEVWQKGKTILLKNPKLFRRDTCGATMKRNEYGNRDSDYGWEIDHIDPDGSDALDNLQPLHWENNVAKSDSGRSECVRRS